MTGPRLIVVLHVRVTVSYRTSLLSELGLDVDTG